MPDRAITPENIPYQRETILDSIDDSSSDEETTRSTVSWNREELNYILFEFDTFIMRSTPPLAPFPRGNPPGQLCHRVAKKLVQEQIGWRHSVKETAKMLRQEVNKRDAPQRNFMSTLMTIRPSSRFRSLLFTDGGHTPHSRRTRPRPGRV
ncbi:hypothetical protein Glove_303g99 [Diversispora epigaea]|uniref:Uncharacterized protein n=1 Tax=Diversispora epigaea TaxID=1348612 RepID=A0A397HVJ9_9GLOM|nr:hypothetical protein Glove_303g99 [Diversispora epigaea]